MTTLMPQEKMPEENATAAPAARSRKPKAKKKARVGPRRADVASVRGKSSPKATPAKKAPTVRAKAEAPKPLREGSKIAKLLDLLKRPGGVTSAELIRVTGWLPHSVRGFLSGTVGKKMGLTVTSSKGEDRERTYGVEA
jgi:hypothetical protein